MQAEHHEESKKGKEKKQKRVEGMEQGDGSKSPAGQDPGSQTQTGLEAGGGTGKASQLADAGGSGQVAGRPGGLIKAELKKSGVPISFKTLEQ